MNEKANSNGTSALAKLLNQLNLPTLALILLTGGGNWLATKEDGRLTREEAIRVAREVHEMHGAIVQFEDRQKEELRNQNKVLDILGQLKKQ